MPSTRLTRRRFLGTSAGALLAAGLWPGAMRAADSGSGEFRFFCMNDLHCQDEDCGQWLESRVVRQMNQTREPVDFVLILGDLVERGTRQELAMVRDVFKSLKIPAHVVCGNHDYSGKDNRETFEELFPRSVNYTFEHKGWQFVALDSTQGSQYKDTAVQAGTLAWLDETLPKLDKSKPTIAFTHFPLGEKVTYRPKNADDLLGRFADHNLRAVLSGHFHGKTERKFKSTLLTTGQCCALKRTNHDKTTQKGYSLYQVKGNQLTREFVEVPTA